MKYHMIGNRKIVVIGSDGMLGSSLIKYFPHGAIVGFGSDIDIVEDSEKLLNKLTNHLSLFAWQFRQLHHDVVTVPLLLIK